MLDHLIRFSLNNRVLVIAVAALLMIIGGRDILRLPIDVFPDLTRPRVVVLTEAPGMAPEEVETLISIPLETALNGATGVIAVRSSSAIGLSAVQVEFDWGTDVYIDRQIVAERLALAKGRLPAGIEPQMAPISSLTGQIMMVGLTVDTKETPEGAEPTSMLELRQIADWVIRRRLLAIPGVAQVFSIGGERGGQRQVQVLVDPNELRRLDVTLDQVERVVAESNENATGGYLIRGPREQLVRSLGRVQSLEDLEMVVVDGARTPPLLLREVAKIRNGPELSRGIASVNGRPAVLLTVAKQPGADTRELTAKVLEAFDEMRASLPADVVVDADIYRQDDFIERAIANVSEALLHGGLLVVIVLFVFLLNLRTTFITLTAIPLSIVVTALIFSWFGLSINTMTLGGLAVAIGELVDDAIVDVENIFRRLRENRLAGNPKRALRVVYEASIEVRSSIVYATVLVVLVFLPLFALSGMEGRLFTPLGMAYIISIGASLLVSLAVTPVLSYWLLPRAQLAGEERDGWLLRGLKWIFGKVIAGSLRRPMIVLSTVSLAATVAVLYAARMGRDFLPAFNEGSVLVGVTLPPGTSLYESDRIGAQLDAKLMALEDVVQLARRSGRAELDEHVDDVYRSDITLAMDPDSPRSREEQLAEIRKALDEVPGIESTSGRSETEQPLAHLISHMLSGVKAQVAVKIYGDDLAVLRRIAQEVRAAIEGTPGVVDLAVEPQVLVPQMQIRLNRERLAQRGLTSGEVNHTIQTAMQGRVVSQILEGEATFDLVVRFDDEHRESVDALRQLAIHLPSGGTIPLEEVATIDPEAYGPNTINRDDARRRIVVQCNTSGRALSDVRDDIQARLKPVEEQLAGLGPGYFIQYGGQFESEESATRLIGILSIFSLIGMVLVLYSLFRSINLALQVLACLPMAAIGAVAALYLTGQSLSVPAMVGFVSLAGIASRNGILLLNHYLHLVQFEGERMTQSMVIRAGQERLAPVMMTALTSGIGLIPIALAGNEPGREILYPVATVIIGGLVSSTLLEFLVRPALFWTFGRAAAARVIAEQELGSERVEETAANALA